jgi:hypothetical protein
MLIAWARVLVPRDSKEILFGDMPLRTSSDFIWQTELRVSSVSPGRAMMIFDF